MRTWLFAKIPFFLTVGFICQLSPSHVFAAAIWTNSNDGLWSIGSNWLGGNLPRLGLGSTYITNAGTKTVTVDATTPEMNLWLNGLNIWAPPGGTNTLLLSNMGTNVPLIISNQTLTIADRGALRITNSSLVVTGKFLSFNVWAGSVTLDSGLLLVREEPLTSNVTVVARIGRTNAASLTINGGEMYATEVLLGESPGGQFGRSSGTLSMRGGLLTVAAEFSVGDGSGCTGLVNMTSGEIHVINEGTNVTRVGDFGRGEMTVSNASFNVGNLSIARHDSAVGILTLQPGGVLTGSDDLSIGRFSGSTGLLHVAGGTLAVTNNPVWVGREGHGQLVISNGLVLAQSVRVAAEPTNTSAGALVAAGGRLAVSSELLVGDGAYSNGTVTISAGALFVTNGAASAMLRVQSGTVTVRGATTVVDRLIMTNSAGRVVFSGGTLQSKETTISNGAPFTVGDGVARAELVLDGGIHSFANGLVISPNAIVSGCGTIVGTIVNNGTLAVTNCTSAGAAPTISQQPSSLTVTQGAAATFTVVAAGDAPLSYQWRRGVPGPAATDIPGATGAALTITNAQGSDSGSYYVVVSNSSGSVTSSVAGLRVLVAGQIEGASLSGNEFIFRFSSVTGLTYTIEYKDTLVDASWTPLQTVVGTGDALSITNLVTAAPSRFFRVRIE